MDSMLAFAMGEMTRGNEQRVFDWDGAAKYIKEHNVKNCGAGLQSDLEWTEGGIWENGEPVLDDYTYLASTWAIPVITLRGEEAERMGIDEIPCWKWKHETEWDSKTKWPDSSLKILGYTDEDIAKMRNVQEESDDE